MAISTDNLRAYIEQEAQRHHPHDIGAEIMGEAVARYLIERYVREAEVLPGSEPFNMVCAFARRMADTLEKELEGR